MTNLSPATKGLITGGLMILSSVAIYFAKGNFENSLQYITYAIYVGGIYWTINDFRRQTNEAPSWLFLDIW
jgi:hypothetical protein